MKAEALDLDRRRRRLGECSRGRRSSTHRGEVENGERDRVRLHTVAWRSENHFRQFSPARGMFIAPGPYQHSLTKLLSLHDLSIPSMGICLIDGGFHDSTRLHR